MATGEDFTRMIEFMSLVGQLKRVKRAGWVLRDITAPESVSDHMYRMALLSLCFSNSPALDTNRCIKLSLVHDLAECIVGDITPEDGIIKEEKEKKEKDAMRHICGHVESTIGDELFRLWEEYEEQTSKESQFVKDLDRFEMILQAHEYEQSENRGRFLQEFFDSTRGKFKTDEVNQWALGLENMRNKTDSCQGNKQIDQSQPQCQQIDQSQHQSQQIDQSQS